MERSKAGVFVLWRSGYLTMREMASKIARKGRSRGFHFPRLAPWPLACLQKDFAMIGRGQNKVIRIEDIVVS